MFLICAWCILYQGITPQPYSHYEGYPLHYTTDMTAEQAFQPFAHLALPLWHDATNGYCYFRLTVLDTLNGLQKAYSLKFVDMHHFDVAAYEHYERVENGDLNWCIEGKFLAMAGPQSLKHGGKDKSGGRFLTPLFYIPYFRKHNVTLVIRLNQPYYEASEFTKHGISHKDLYFPDGTNPSDAIILE